MKLENLSIIFVIIIVPLTIIFSEYIDNKIDTAKLELEYNKRLLQSTQDAINAYQNNTLIDERSDVVSYKIKDILASANMFMNSLASNFNYVGLKADQMREYVPALVFTLYDGYYIYSPSYNALTELSDTEFDSDYSKPGEFFTGLKPYVSYTCRYQNGGNYNFYITYTLDNFITINGLVNGKIIYDYGYLYGGIEKINDESYKYGGITYKKSDTEELKECLGDKIYSYVKINGTKYYLDEEYFGDDTTITINGDITVKKRIGYFLHR